jgi:putative DNA primase/helicase
VNNFTAQSNNSDDWRSSRSNPCPICGDTDGSCKAEGALILCFDGEQHRDNAPTGYQYRKPCDGGMGGIFAPATENRKPDHRAAEYVYLTADGQPHQRVSRYYQGGKKQFGQARWDGSRWVNGLGRGFERVPYRLPEVTTANLVLICEGEKDAETAKNSGLEAELGAVTTTNPQGAGKWPAGWGKKYLSGKTVIILPDNDQPGADHTAAVRRDVKPHAAAVVVVELPDLPPGGDLTDYLERGGTVRSVVEMVTAALAEPESHTVEQPAATPEADGELEESTLGQSNLSANFCEVNFDRFAYDEAEEQWFTYIDGIWRTCKRGVIERELTKLVRAAGQPFKADLIRGAAYLCQLELSGREWQTERNLLPLANGVLDISTRELKQHSPSYNFRWQLPYDYDSGAQCPKIQGWLGSAVGGDMALVNVLRAYLNAILLGRTDLQKFLELIGPGGTGKSTLIRLAIGLVGTLNTFTTELKRLEQNRFEAAGIVGKRLIVITDSENYAGQISILKAITGQDSIPLERKYKDPDPEGLIPDALVIVAANETIQTSDHTSGLARRRLTVPFLNKIPDTEQRNLISWNGGRVSGELAGELPGLLNWVLALTPAEVTQFIKGATNDSETLRRYRVETLLNSNPIADWADNSLILDPNSKTYVGVAKKIRLSVGKPEMGVTHWDGYENSDRLLYPSYCEFCLTVGNKPIGLKRFVPLLKDLLIFQLGISITHRRDKVGFYIQGVKIRHDGDDSSPQTISGNLPDPDRRREWAGVE